MLYGCKGSIMHRIFNYYYYCFFFKNKRLTLFFNYINDKDVIVCIYISILFLFYELFNYRYSCGFC